MPKTLLEILTDVNAVLDLEAAAPSGTEETTRSNYANQAVWDIAAKGQLSEFKREFITSTSSLATISLPANFHEVQETPRILDSSGSWVKYPTIEVEEKYELSSADRYSYVLGNPSEGYNLVFNNIIVGGTLSVIYQRFPSGLLTLTDKSEISDPQAIVRKVESYVLYARSDDRFTIAEERAEGQIANLMGREMKSSSGESRDTQMKFRSPLKNLA